MACQTGASNFERKKVELLNYNLWKSNFISLWTQFGVFKDVEGVQCFDYYDIDGPGEGQERMSRHLKQPDLWETTMDNDLDWVHLVFNLGKLVELTPENFLLWLNNYKTELASHTFSKLHYEIVNNVVTSAYFLSADDLVPVDPPTDPVTYEPATYTQINDTFLNHLALTIAERRNIDSAVPVDDWGVVSSGDIFYDELVSLADIESLMDWMTEHVMDYQGYYVFELPMLELEIRSWLMENSIGTDILDQLVIEGSLLGIGSIGTSTMTYSFPVEAARKMGGKAFVTMVELGVDFDYKVDSHWYDFFIDIIGFVLAAVAAYFGFYHVAISLFLSTVAAKTGSPVLKVLATVYSLGTGGLTSLSTMGVSEAASLLMNVYGLYMELSFKPDTLSEEEPVENESELLYKAPYSAYSDLYCYKPLTSVSLDGEY